MDWQEFLKEYQLPMDVLKDVGISLGTGFVGNRAAHLANKMGFNINPTLAGTLGALAPWGYRYATDSGSVGNARRWGLKGLSTVTDNPDADLRNRPQYVKDYLKGMMGADPDEYIQDLWHSPLPRHSKYVFNSLVKPMQTAYNNLTDGILSR